MSVMIDLETWGTSPGSAIRSIGAVIFSERSQEEYAVGEDPASTFYRNVDDSTSLGVRSPSPVQWWSQQSDDALRAFEAACIQRALEENDGNRTHAAKALDISVRRLPQKMSRHGVS